MPQPFDPPLRIAIDVGGTFTDLVLQDRGGHLLVLKVPSVQADPSEGVLQALADAASKLELGREEMLRKTELFFHGSTVATNTLLEGSGARVGMLTTRGFRDSLEIRRGIRANQWDHRSPFAEVLVPRYLRCPVGGRLDREGRELEPIVREDVHRAIGVFEREQVEAVAICLFNSYLNSTHEEEAAEMLRQSLGSVPVTLSSEILPVIGEYSRSSTAVANAYVAPPVIAYLRSLDDRLAAMGLASPLLLIQSNGGAIPFQEIAARPVFLVLSGPAAGVGALRSVREAIGSDDLLSMDIGGTSCDVMLMADARVAMRESIDIAGYNISTPAIDIHTVGAGGGTIAGVDAAGMLFVGPLGAGADPGPACYGLGGAEPTVTDAHLILGRMREGAYASASVTMNVEPARAAISRRVARVLDLEIERAAAGIIELLEERLQQAIERVSVERGVDPGRFTLVAAGGAGPLHAVSVARRLGIRKVYVPRDAGGYCALGMLHSPVRHDLFRVFLSPFDDAEVETLEASFVELEKRGSRQLARDGFARSEHQLSREMDLRYRAQQWSVTVAVSNALNLDRSTVRRAFEEEHQRLYGHIQPGGDLEITALRVTATAAPEERPPRLWHRADGPPSPSGRRAVFIDADSGWCEADVYAGESLHAGHRLQGPLIVEESTTTLLVGVDDWLEVDEVGGFMIEVACNRKTRSMTALDPIRLALVQSRLDFVSRHMGWVMTRTARSPIFSQSHDFSCFLTDHNGTLVSNADGIPIHTGGGGFAVRALLRAFGDDVNEEDVFLLNDPYTAGGNHLPDWVVARPVFVEARLVAFACNRAHQSDIGGGVAGTYNPTATEIFHEGIRLPPLLLVEGGVVREDLWQLLLLNCRTPDLLDGDLRAMLGSTRIGKEHLEKLAAEIGVADLERYLDGILAHAERSFRSAVAELPDGVYEASETTHGDCFEDGEFEIRVALTVDGDSMHVDFSGSAGQLRGFKNSSLANTHSAVYMAVASFFDPRLPRNEGSFRCLQITAPEGSLVNPRPPAPVTMCTVFVAHEIVHAVWKALALAQPERSCAGWGKPIHGVTSSRSGQEEPFVLYHWNALAGAGAVDGRDGFNQIGHLIALGGLTLPELEIFEQLYPVRFLCCEFRLDAAGAGRFRGGSGVDYEVEIEVPAEYSFRGEGLSAPSGYGVAGGLFGAVGTMRMHPHEGEPFDAPAYGLCELGPTRLAASSPGGGGWGSPFERDPAKVLRDVRDGLVSSEEAERTYGVVLRDGGLEVDETATLRLRKRPQDD